MQNADFKILLIEAAQKTKLSFNQLPRWEKLFHIFWFLGPFIMLVERSPADFWLSTLAVVFLIRAVVKKDYHFTNIFWVKTVFIFWTVCLFSSLISEIPYYSTGEAFVWIRFPLFAMATMFWLSEDKYLLYTMLVSTALGMMIMTGILFAEIIIEGDKGGRLTWPYGDLVPGNYLTKVGLPAFVTMVALTVGTHARYAIFLSCICLLTIIASILTGERINFIILVFSGILAGCVWRPLWKRVLILISLGTIVVTGIFLVNPGIEDRFINSFINAIPTGDHSDYYRVMGGGVIAFIEAPFFGIGTANYRELCKDILFVYENFRCDNHPHNYYIQLLAETGIFGLATGLLMVLSIIWHTVSTSLDNRKNVVVATAFIIPLGLFFPIASTADFFGQWNNIFIWSAISLSLGATNINKTKFNLK